MSPAYTARWKELPGWGEERMAPHQKGPQTARIGVADGRMVAQVAAAAGKWLRIADGKLDRLGPEGGAEVRSAGALPAPGR